jgi:Icc-related predicted phosphoesterase
VTRCLFASDLHGREARYRALIDVVGSGAADALFLGGDLLPHPAEHGTPGADCLHRLLVAPLEQLRARMARAYPSIFVIMGNDDARAEEHELQEADARGLLQYIHGRRVACGGCDVYGYACVPPTPFQLKDWERYDVSRYVDPGCVAPEDGWHSVPVDAQERRRATIKADLDRLAGGAALDRAVFLFHTPPYRTHLDRAALDGVKVEGAPVDVHVGSIAVRRFIESRQPLLTLHGHIHESARLTGAWQDRIGRTLLLTAAHDGPELALIRFDLERPAGAVRELR